MFLKILTVASVFIYTVTSGQSDKDKDYQKWDVKLDPALQLYYGKGKGEGWRTICRDGLNIDVAHVVCRQNGFISATTTSIEKSDFPVSDRVITQVLCPSTSNYSLYGETNVMRCKISEHVSKEKTTCRSAKISCNTYKMMKINPYNGQVNLVKRQTATPADGAVKVHLNRTWYYLCNTSFTNTVADSICRQYGYTEHYYWTTLVSTEDSIIATEYTCTNDTGSFECFTHCISNYSIGSCDHPVTLICSFNNISKEYLTSGSQSQCALPLEEARLLFPTCKNKSTSDKNKSTSDRIIIGLLSSLLFISVLALLIITILFCYHKKIKKIKHCCCCRNHEHFNDGKCMRCNRDGPTNDQIPLKDYQSTEH